MSDIPYFPFAYDAEQEFLLHENGLTVRLQLQNHDSRRFPAGMGHHFYFPRHAGTTLQFNADAYWESDENCLPAKAYNALKTLFANGEKIDHRLMDNCFEGWDGLAMITESQAGHRLKIHATQDFGHAVLYVPPNKDFFAFEPVTHLNNAVNMQGSHGLKYLEPNEIWSAQIELTLEPTA